MVETNTSNIPVGTHSDPGGSRSTPSHVSSQMKKQVKNLLIEFNLGYWNILSLNRPTVLRTLLHQLDLFKIDIAAIQEIQWTGSGSIEKGNQKIYFSCHNKNKELGTGFIVSKQLQHIVIEFKPISPRICLLRLRGQFNNYAIISVLAPIEPSQESDKDEFYELLRRTMDQCPRHDIKIIAGDLNAQIGKETEYLPIIGPCSVYRRSNDNGKRVINFAESHGLVLRSTFFPHKLIHKCTRKFPSGAQSQSDHILISDNHKSNILNVKTVRAADVGSDHYLVKARIRHRMLMEESEKLNLKRPLEHKLDQTESKRRRV